ncbi:MAG TPA: DUF3501 family protein [Blastocatellia bacterium]|nr:DUF3501 family protein [Blastocatellia bacterium]
MKPVERNEVIDYVTYEERRDAFRKKVMEAKAPRRIHIGEYLTLLFENHVTMLYQIQEMVRTERMVKEADIQHEIDTYNEVLGAEGEFGCTLLIEIDDPALRNQKLKEWWRLPEKIYLLLEDGTRVWASFDERQRGGERLSSVQYMKFNTGGRVPIAAGVDLPEFQAETKFTEEQSEALREDLRS